MRYSILYLCHPFIVTVVKRTRLMISSGSAHRDRCSADTTPTPKIGQSDAPYISPSLWAFPACHPSSPFAMLQTSPETASRPSYNVIFDNALEAYKKQTGKDLTSDPLFRNLETCHSPDAILAVLRAQTSSRELRNSGDGSLTWLNPTIKVLNSFSTISSVVRLDSFAVARPESIA